MRSVRRRSECGVARGLCPVFGAQSDLHAAWTDWTQAFEARPRRRSTWRARSCREWRISIFCSIVFADQWGVCGGPRSACLGIAIVGDAPIFVAHDSADVWALPGSVPPARRRAAERGGRRSTRLFQHDGSALGEIRSTAGICRSAGLRVVGSRVLASQSEMVDRVRLDHFRGFTRLGSAGGCCRWRSAGPLGQAVRRNAAFEAIGAAFGGSQPPVIAEDLGVSPTKCGRSSRRPASPA